MNTSPATAASESGSRANLAPKAAMVDALHQLACTAPVALAVEYRGLGANDMAGLRRDARAAGATVRIAKNTLTRRAFADTPFASMCDGMTGPLMLVFSSEENISGAASLCRDYASRHECLQIRMLALQGRQLDVSETGRIADLPSREQALAKLMGVMLAPAGQLAMLLKMPATQLLMVLAAIGKQKDAN